MSEVCATQRAQTGMLPAGHKMAWERRADAASCSVVHFFVSLSTKHRLTLIHEACVMAEPDDSHEALHSRNTLPSRDRRTRSIIQWRETPGASVMTSCSRINISSSHALHALHGLPEVLKDGSHILAIP
ncbi:hypothetical protein E2C01_029512 [Portunus trituberculatus]|uniref:Uncharacterized protein n=1 Tax=Portunus trituberculatus TaxID=210409 RepID=A0A5B7EUS9_PORTR|nr:hypothetical protein [Portunus trituberculatus]